MDCVWTRILFQNRRRFVQLYNDKNSYLFSQVVFSDEKAKGLCVLYIVNIYEYDYVTYINKWLIYIYWRPNLHRRN